ncbi:MAG TPA: hypothetical protein VKX17_09015 [Planctomycetota bacterium]|nr:hypothetical protein [Planctomycetota bacterium]
MKLFLAVSFAMLAAYSLHADTVVFKNDEELDGKILERNDDSLKLEVEYGTVIVPMSKVKRIEPDTPEKAAERERKKAEAAELAAKMKDEGKVLYKGKWVTEDEKKADEDKIAEAKKKKAADEAKKKADDDAKAKAAAAAALAAQQKQQQDNSRANRFNDQNNRRNNSYNNNYNNQYNGTSNGYGNGSSYNNYNNYNNSSTYGR